MINGKLEYRVLLRCKRLTAWCRMKHVCNHVSVAFFAYQVELCFHHGLRHLQATPWFSFANLPSPLSRMNNVSTHLSIFDTRTMVCLGSDASASPPYRVSGSLQPPELVLSVMHFEGQCLGRSLRGRSYARTHTHTAWIRLTSAATKAATGPCLWILPAKIQRQEKGQGHQKH